MSEDLGTMVSSLRHAFLRPDGPLEVLQDISLSVGQGEIVSILGPSGCGKTTLLKCLAGLIEPSDGDISVAGMAPCEALAANAVGFAFQDAALLSWRSVGQNILLPAELGSQACQRKVDGARLEWLLSLTGLQTFREFLPGELSGGMKQRVSLARALLLSPKLLLLDEPFGSLDLLTRTSLGAELGRIVHETKVPTIIVTHSIEEAVFLGTHLIILSSLPAQIVEELVIDTEPPRELAFLESRRFLQTVAHCRSLLMKGRGGI